MILQPWSILFKKSMATKKKKPNPNHTFCDPCVFLVVEKKLNKKSGIGFQKNLIVSLKINTIMTFDLFDWEISILFVHNWEIIAYTV